MSKAGGERKWFLLNRVAPANEEQFEKRVADGVVLPQGSKTTNANILGRVRKPYITKNGMEALNTANPDWVTKVPAMPKDTPLELEMGYFGKLERRGLKNIIRKAQAVRRQLGKTIVEYDDTDL